MGLGSNEPSEAGWSVCYPGFSVTGHYSKPKRKYVLTIRQPDPLLGVTSFKVGIPAPLPGLTTLLLPGSTTLLQLSALEEVRVLCQDGDAGEVRRLNRWFGRIINDDQFVTVIKEFWWAECVYCVEARCGVCYDVDEAFIVVSIFKYVGDDDGAGSVGTGVSDSAYQTFLDGL